ncbi:ATP F0F1 synthase subunit B [Zhengella mangrovi]|uniref:ATP synthase subunit b n=1 Tax=Zhengella mangrovi TaxID=1982044 RepID=A0A2G1QNM7_9HYPH|nr:F0F1 ATP synthase subunit B [Zhengella mangrovi]PHP67071.1 ATP F0F1 synthase subunit B [Zhengella mangrovi]
MDATSLASVWATVALFIFIGILLWLKVPSTLAKSLDARADKIRNDLDEARKLREEAQQVLAEYQRKRKEAEEEAADIVSAAKRDAELLKAEAKQKADEYVTRRTAVAEQKIAQAERDAINEVRSSAVDLAVEATRTVLAGKVDAATAGKLFKDSLAEVKDRMN